jgi:hypothetical protein
MLPKKFEQTRSMSLNVKENTKILALSKSKITIKANKFKKFGRNTKNDGFKKSHFYKFDKKNLCNLSDLDKFRIFPEFRNREDVLKLRGNLGSIDDKIRKNKKKRSNKFSELRK